MTSDASPVRVAVTGAGGRMGRTVLEACTTRADTEVVGAVNRSPTDPVAGVSVAEAARLPSLLADRDPDVLIDFTAPVASVEYAGICAETGVPMVIGTTGFNEAQLESIRRASETIPVLRAANFSRGVAVLRQLVREATARLPDYDIEITETHHRGKRDAPSGTAVQLADDVESVRGPSDRTHGRQGTVTRSDTEVGIHARRAGDVFGVHDVLFGGDEQTLTLTHRAGSRRVFAAGAIDAAAWLVGRSPGRYEFEEVLA